MVVIIYVAETGDTIVWFVFSYSEQVAIGHCCCTKLADKMRFAGFNLLCYVLKKNVSLLSKTTITMFYGRKEIACCCVEAHFEQFSFLHPPTYSSVILLCCAYTAHGKRFIKAIQ